MFYAYKALAVLADVKEWGFFAVLRALSVVDDGKIVKGGVRELRRLAEEVPSRV
ncbi:hypothetical protein [Endothiovibrio diazotrophicus]